MNYAYDILLNFNELDYAFYDWNINDNILHIRKTPIFKISSEQLYNIINNNFCVNQEFLKKISNRTEVFTNKNVKIIRYVCLFSDTRDVVAIWFSNNGKEEKISRLLLDEEEDILELSKEIDNFNLDIEIGNEKKNNKFKTRNELDVYRYIKKEFNKKNYERLKYIYFECFNEVEEDYEKIVKKLRKEIDLNWDNSYEKIFNILKLSSIKKSKN